MKTYWVFLNTSQTIVRWNVARVIMIPAKSLQKNDTNIPGYFLISRLKNPKYLKLELDLEKRRCENFPKKISRLTGMFLFETKEQADRAKKNISLGHFNDFCLSEVAPDGNCIHSRHDSNWITYFESDNKSFPENWESLYWQGKPLSGMDPLWEIITETPMIIYNRAMRNECYKRFEYMKCQFLLRFGILAAACGFDIGVIVNFIVPQNNCLIIKHAIKFSESEAIKAWSIIQSEFPEESKAIRFYSSDILFISPDFRNEDYCLRHASYSTQCFLQ